jgi:hypothetical protein
VLACLLPHLCQSLTMICARGSGRPATPFALRALSWQITALRIYCPDWNFGRACERIEAWLSVKTLLIMFFFFFFCSISLFSCLRRHADVLSKVTLTKVVTSLRLRSRTDKANKRNRNQEETNSNAPCDLASSSPFRSSVFCYNMTTPLGAQLAL